MNNFPEALERAAAHAPFLRIALEQQTDVAALLAQGIVPAAVPFDRELPVGVALRRARRRESLVVAIADLAGALDLNGVTQRLTHFADAALDAAIRAAILERSPDAEPVGFAAIALGKQGSCELNYSSDIDPILIFDPATLPHRPREEPQEAAVRIGRRVVELLQARDAEGYVLRVDLRLRPSPEATPIALPVGAAISYYESQALPWERAAFIRARAAAGDIALGQRFLDAIRPFVWRRAVDFGAVGEIREITRRIRDHHAQGQAFGPGYDLKRGRGGIREVEFFAQIHQLIHGGRDPSLRAPATMDALDRLAAAGRIGVDEAETLKAGYIALRTTEHRLQMVDDLQTHALPRAPEALDNVAQLAGFETGEALIRMLGPHVTAVGRIYDSLDPPDAATLSSDDDSLSGQLQTLGFADHGTATQVVDRWRGGAYPALRSPAARLALEAESKTAVIRLAIAIAERVTKRLGAIDPQVGVANVDEALRLVVHSADVRIAVHPTQKATLADVLPRIQAKWPALKHVELVDDDTLAPGGCRIYSGAGEVDADLDLQLARIAQELVPSPKDPTA